MIKLSNQQRLQIENAASTLCINARDAFFRAVARALEFAPIPPSLNDVLRSIQMALAMTPTADILISRSTMPEVDDYYEYQKRY